MKKKLAKLLALLLLAAGLLFGSLYYAGYTYLIPGYHIWYYTPQKYKVTLIRINSKRQALAKAEQPLRSRMFEEIITTDVFPYWYGTRWNFYGQSTIPGQGSIACGYFVTTVLRDMGMVLNRVALAQCASEEMIKKLVQKQYIWHFNDMSLPEFVSAIQAKGRGVYIIGLDNHTGFIWVNSRRQVRFIHSSGRFPFCVINEDAASSKVLQKSMYKVAGKLTADENAMKQWVSQGS